MRSTMVAIIGDDSDAPDVLYRGLREFSSDRVVLLSEAKHASRSEGIKKDLERMKIPVTTESLSSRVSMEEVFSRFARINERETGNKIIVNVDTDYQSSCIALSAAFVNGVQAIGMMQDNIIAYPIMKFSYYNALSDKKMTVLQSIAKRGEYDSLESISRELKMSLPLVTYHIRGTRDKPGLEELGLVETRRNRGKIITTLSPLGRLIVNGLVEVKKEEKRRK
ncbi:MAG TPA: DUF6293 family protein [Candidatus Norongarragalinales archaeon]|nr:DUF6293 family protein [Candidatus Norongarragalinales archaeon]